MVYLKGDFTTSPAYKVAIGEANNDDDEVAKTIPDNEDLVDVNGRLLNQQPMYDKIINAEVQLQLREDVVVGKVAGLSVAVVVVGAMVACAQAPSRKTKAMRTTRMSARYRAIQF